MHYKHTTAAIIISLAAASECFAVQYLTVDEALKLSFPAMTSAENTDVLFSDEQKKKIEEELPDKLYINGQQIRKVFEQDHLLGFLFIDRVVGKHLLIDYSIALSPEGKVLRIEVLDYRESYGSEIRSRDWLSQFEGKDSKSSGRAAGPSEAH